MMLLNAPMRVGSHDNLLLWVLSPSVCVAVFRCYWNPACVPGIARICALLHHLQPNKRWIAPVMQSVRWRSKHPQTAGPTCPNKRVADWQNILFTLPQIRLHSFKAPRLCLPRPPRLIIPSTAATPVTKTLRTGIKYSLSTCLKESLWMAYSSVMTGRWQLAFTVMKVDPNSHVSRRC